MLAAVITGLVLFLFLHSLRSTLIVLLAIPISLLIALIVVWATGLSLNGMTLIGLTTAIGVLVDDSIVRGTTTRQIVRLLFESGAKEVHVRITAPPIVHPCFYGIDMASKGELAAYSREPRLSTFTTFPATRMLKRSPKD